MATAVAAAQAENEAAHLALSPQIEGMEDYLRLNLTAEARSWVVGLYEDSLRRRALLGACIAANQALLADGYPAVEIRPIPESEYANLRANSETILAALGRFTGTGPAVSGTITFDPPVPKP